MSFDVLSLQDGDIIKCTSTNEVIGVDRDGTVHIIDVQSDEPFYIKQSDIDDGSLRVEMVKRAVRRPAMVGDQVTGGAVADTQWRRGTVLRSVANPEWLLALSAEGEWIALSVGDGSLKFSFDEMAGEGSLSEFTVAYLP